MDKREGWIEEKDRYKGRMDRREGWIEEKDG